MRARTAVLLIVLAALGIFSALNWSAIVFPTTLHLVFARVEAPVGLVLQDLSVGQVVDLPTAVFLTRDGDINQEDLTNDAIRVWDAMPCFRFVFTDNVGVDHFSLPGHPAVLQRLLTHLQRPKSGCP